MAPTPLAARLTATRDRHFFGRSGELAQFRQALDCQARATADSLSCALFFLHGPGGIGKSMLMRRFAAEARSAGRAVVEIDGRSIVPTPAVFETQAARALTGPGAVLLIDTFEQCRDLEPWLRERFLPRLPVDSLVVLAGRHAPDLDWRSDPGWADAMRVVQVQNFPPEDAMAVLTARGVPQRLHSSLLAFTNGHPLALSLAAEVAGHDPNDTLPWTPTPDVLELLLSRLVGELPSPAHRYALEVCAHARSTTEELLRAAKVEDPAAMFDWLRGLSYIEAGRDGLFPHDVVRDTLDADLRWRDPEGYEAMHRRLRKHLLARARAAQGAGLLPAMGAFNYLRRYGGVMPQLYDAGRDGEVVEEAFRPADRPAVLRLALAHRRAFSPELVRFWLDRQPEAFYVHRRNDSGDVVGFVACLTLTAPDEEETATDPVVEAAWTQCRAAGPLRPGEHLVVARFMHYATDYRPPSPVQVLIMQRVLANVWHAQNLAWSFLVTSGPEYWEPAMNYIDHQLVPALPAHADLGFGLFAHDWRAVPLDAWFEVMESWELFGPEPRRDARTEPLAVLSRSEFDAAVLDALRSNRHRDLLSASPLIRSRVVVESSADSGEPDDAVAVLQRLLGAAVETLREDPREAKLHRVLTTTYFHRVTTQEAAAEQLLLSLSTYRRHLKRGQQRVCDILWHQEMNGPRHLTGLGALSPATESRQR